MVETKNIFHKTGNRQGYHAIISFSPEEKVSAEQAMYVLEHFAKDVLGDDYEAVFAVHTDREHMHGHLIWNSVSVTTGKSIIHRKETGRIICNRLRINIVMSWDLLSCRQSTAETLRISVETSGKGNVDERYYTS